MPRIGACVLGVLLAAFSGGLAAQERKADDAVRYVGVDGSSNDAVMLDEADVMQGQPVCRLTSGQAVTVLAEAGGQYVKIRATCNGKTVDGWVKSGALLKKLPGAVQPRVTETGASADAISSAVRASIDAETPELPAVRAPEDPATGENAGAESDTAVRNRRD